MPLSTLALTSPNDATTWPDHPALQFYATYGQDFTQAFQSTSPERYYAADCQMHAVDNSILKGGEVLWQYFGQLYPMFPKVTRNFLSIVIVSDNSGTHEMHNEMITTLYLDAQGNEKVEVPQAFTYTIGQADEGKGTYGLQFRKLRCYYDMSLIDKAKAKLQR
ncbi:hypothetical protein B0A50_02828 [Salinomyces thailandicus]|uniref:SnoaL-like domain-containing protein n=1 Tax=Salinomyces thailandicus TaxID=706561 RepID=A0A4V5N6V5_9PEZI|nr:hypothetical protein B0A50_02828 [Salinomyces thailandica]